MALGKDIKKIINSNVEITKGYHQGDVVWEGIYMAQDSDFSGTVNGEFWYMGTELEVKIPHIIKGVAVTSYYGMFNNTNVTKVVSDNPNITNMNGTFYKSNAPTLDLSSFDTSNVIDMAYMFARSQATTLDLRSFNTSKVTDMYEMFESSKATTLDLSSFNTSNVTDMSQMFDESKATTGYARTQADADRFNNSSYIPYELYFVVKP